MMVAVLGSGGIGRYYGALLAQGGHLEAMQQRGLRIRIYAWPHLRSRSARWFPSTSGGRSCVRGSWSCLWSR